MENDEPESPDPNHDSTQSKRGKRVFHLSITYLNAALVGNYISLYECQTLVKRGTKARAHAVIDLRAVAL